MKAALFIMATLAARASALARPLSTNRFVLGASVRPSHGICARLYSGAQPPSFRGPMQEKVEAALTAHFSPVHLEVLNESHGRIEDESHFKVGCVISTDALIMKVR